MKSYFQDMLFKSRKYIRNSEDIRGELIRGKLIFYTSWVAVCIMLVFIVSDIMLAQPFNIILDIVALLFYVLGLMSMRKGCLTIPKVNLIIVTNVILVLSASRDGRYSGNQFIWFPLIASVFLFFSVKQLKYIIITLAISMASILFLEFTSYSLLKTQEPEPGYLFVNYLICFSVGMLLMLVYLFVLSNVNRDTQRKLFFFNRRLRKKNIHLKRLHEELDSYVYKTTHDLRAPLNSLLGIIELVKVENNVDAIKSYVQLQEVSVRKLDAYIMDIINLSKNSKMELTCKEIDVSELINTVFRDLEYLENSVHREIKVIQFSPFRSDAHRVTMIVSNLVSNAIRYRDQSKKSQHVIVTAEVKDRQLMLTVKDNGLGIPKEYHEKIFGMFFRANDRVSGSGLGLYIVKEAVEKLNGSITVNSEVGVGSEFVVTLPSIS